MIMDAIKTIESPADAAGAAAEKRCYTVEDLQIILGVSRGSVYKLLGQNEFRWFKIGSAIRISARSFDEWLDSKL
jgi:excisionase family DNA binding protein